MALSDLFGTNAYQPPSAVSSDLEDIYRKLTHELVETRQRNAHLEASHKVAVAERKEAVERMREAEDSLRMKESVLDTLERRIDSLESENTRLRSVETELELLREDQLEHPLSRSDAEFRYEQLADVFDQLKDTLSCAVCYEPYVKDQAVSLLCGHSFCQSCFSNWEERHVEAWKFSTRQGVYPGPDCPECRSQEVRRGKVRIWALEEVVRLVDRATRDFKRNVFTPPKPSGGRACECTRTTTAKEEVPSDAMHANATGDLLDRADADCPSIIPVRFEADTDMAICAEPVPASVASLPRHDQYLQDGILDRAHSVFPDDPSDAAVVGLADVPSDTRTTGDAEQIGDAEHMGDEVADPNDPEVLDARTLLRPRTPLPYLAVLRP